MGIGQTWAAPDATGAANADGEARAPTLSSFSFMVCNAGAISPPRAIRRAVQGDQAAISRAASSAVKRREISRASSAIG